MRDGDAKPLTDGSEPKDDVAHDANSRIEIVEESRYAGRQDEDPNHLDQDGHSVRQIVGVVRRGEPREVGNQTELDVNDKTFTVPEADLVSETVEGAGV